MTKELIATLVLKESDGAVRKNELMARAPTRQPNTERLNVPIVLIRLVHVCIFQVKILRLFKILIENILQHRKHYFSFIKL